MATPLTDNEASSTSATLLQRIRSSRDHEAWNEFVRRYWRLVWWFARKAGLSAQEAEDVVQEVFTDIVRMAVSFDYDPGKGRFRGLLQTVTQRRVIDRVRRSAPRAGPLPPSEAAAAIISPDPDWQRAELRADLVAALALVAREVEPATFQAFQLLVIEEWPVRKAAAFLSLSEESVYAAKSRVLARLRRHLQECGKREGE